MPSWGKSVPSAPQSAPQTPINPAGRERGWVGRFDAGVPTPAAPPAAAPAASQWSNPQEWLKPETWTNPEALGWASEQLKPLQDALQKSLQQYGRVSTPASGW